MRISMSGGDVRISLDESTRMNAASALPSGHVEQIQIYEHGQAGSVHIDGKPEQFLEWAKKIVASFGMEIAVSGES